MLVSEINHLPPNVDENNYHLFVPFDYIKIRSVIQNIYHNISKINRVCCGVGSDLSYVVKNICQDRSTFSVEPHHTKQAFKFHAFRSRENLPTDQYSDLYG